MWAFGSGVGGFLLSLSESYSLVVVCDFSPCGAWALVFAAHGLSSCSSWALEHRLSLL